MFFTNISIIPYTAIAFILFSALVLLAYLRKKQLAEALLAPAIYENLRRSFLPFMRPFRVGLLIAAFAALALALLDPRSRSLSTDLRLQGIDLMLVYDVSRSMDVRDNAPSRLEAAKAAGEKLADSLTGNRIGLIAFAAEAFRLLPLTTDVDAVKLFLQDLNTGLIGSQSTDIGKALDTAVESFSQETLTHKAVLLLTDGENLDGDPKTAVDNLRKKGIQLFIVGLGTDRGGAVPIMRNGEEAGTMRDMLGQTVVSRRNQAAMEALARSGDGAYYPVEQVSAVADHINRLQKTSFGTRAQSFLEPEFRFFALIAMGALLLFLFLPERKLLSLVLLLTALPLHGFTGSRKAYEAYNKGEYPSALRYYQEDLVKNPKKDDSKFGENAALYKMERAERAENGFLGLTNVQNRRQALGALFNAGNAQVQGQKWDEALSSYGAILKELPPSEELYKKAANNYLYVLQQKKQQNQQQNPKKSENKDKGSQNPQDKNQRDDNKKGGQQPQQPGEGKGEAARPEEQKDQTQSRPISPNEVENLLGVAQAEEKQNLKRQRAKKAKGFFSSDKY